MKDASVVILPWLGEFGWMIVRHCRFVHRHPAVDKVVCCEHGHECLFPSATEFFTDWKNPIPESERWEGGRWRDPGASSRYYAELTHVLQERFPGREIVVPSYDCHWHMSDAPGFKYTPTVSHYLPSVHIVLAPRNRAFDTTRNWKHWNRLSDNLRSAGLMVGCAGRRETSHDIAADAYAWDHPYGDTAGTVDLLRHCDLYVGVDSGISHLAALMDTPTLIIQSPDQPHNMFDLMKRANKSGVEILQQEAWYEPELVEEHVLRHAWRIRMYGRYDVAVYATVSAANDNWQSWAVSLFDRIGAESSTTGKRIVTRLRILDAKDSDIQAAHQYRHRAHEIDCVPVGRRPVAPLARPCEASRIIHVDDSCEPNTLTF